MESEVEELNETERFSGIEKPKQRAFLAAFGQLGTITAAAEGAGISSTIHYTWLADEAYRDAFRQSRDMICAHIEAALVDRLVNGWEEPIFYNGEQVGTKRKFDNGAAMAFLDRHDPDFRKGKSSQVDVSVGKPEELTITYVNDFFGKVIDDPGVDQ